MISDTFINHYEQRINEEGRDLVFKFFITFSRFECALKSTIIFANGNTKKVEPNWDKFISTIRDRFDKNRSETLNNAVNYLLENPPKIQTLLNGQLSWQSRHFDGNTPEINKLRNHISDIRNNLFHGGKFNGIYQPAVSRNYILINSALEVLNEWLSLSQIVSIEFLKEM